MKDTINRRKFLRGSAVVGAAALATQQLQAATAQPSRCRQPGAAVSSLRTHSLFAARRQRNVWRIFDNRSSVGGFRCENIPDCKTRFTAAFWTRHTTYLHIGTANRNPHPLFGTGPCFGWSSQEMLGWIHAGGGQELFDELMDDLQLNVVSFFNSPMPAQPLGWFSKPITDASQMNGLKYRTVGLAADVMLEMGMSVVQLSRWRNPTCNEIRPDRCGRIQQPDI